MSLTGSHHWIAKTADSVNLYHIWGCQCMVRSPLFFVCALAACLCSPAVPTDSTKIGGGLDTNLMPPFLTMRVQARVYAASQLAGTRSWLPQWHQCKLCIEMSQFIDLHAAMPRCHIHTIANYNIDQAAAVDSYICIEHHNYYIDD